MQEPKLVIRHAVLVTIIGLGVLAWASVAGAQSTLAPQGQAQQRAPSIFDNLNHGAPSGPAPKRDFNGTWAGPINSEPKNVPSMTRAGQKVFALNKPERQYTLAGTNDPFDVCDPLGMPRKILVETRSMVFAAIPNRMLQLWQYDRVWREIWADGRELPKNVGGKGGPDPRWYGYSVGHWESDDTFVIDTNGSDDRSWIDGTGHPHSVDMTVKEHYARKDQDTLDLAITINDPKYYTAPILGENHFKWVPNQELAEEDICAPSQIAAYQAVIGVPAGAGVKK